MRLHACRSLMIRKQHFEKINVFLETSYEYGLIWFLDNFDANVSYLANFFSNSCVENYFPINKVYDTLIMMVCGKGF